MNINTLDKHCRVLRSLPGVSTVTTLQQAHGGSLEIQTSKAEQAAFLDDILADSIQGTPVRFTHPGPELGSPSKDYYPAEQILEDYGKLLKGLPGVCHLGTMTIRAGEWLPALETAIKVVACSKADQQFLRELLEPEIAGTQVVVTGK